MRIILLPRAEKQLKRLTKIDQLAVARKIRLVREDYTAVGEEKLTGVGNIYRIRVGNYRIVYKRTKEAIYVVLIGHRREIYQLVKQLLG